MFGNTNITESSLEALAGHTEHKAKLETLDLNGCSGIPSERISESALG